MKKLKLIFELLLVVISLFLFSCRNSDNNKNSDEVPYYVPTPNIGFSILNIYPHDSLAFTQGLEYLNGKLLESTGDYKNSSLRLVDLHSGRVLQKHIMGSEEIFGEGATILNKKIFQLTWQNNIVLVYNVEDITTPVARFIWPKEGWGITNNGVEIIISDGSSFLYFVDSKTFHITKKIQVVNHSQPVEKLNELEFTKDGIYANVFGQKVILRIDPITGIVTGIINCENLMRESRLDFIDNPEKVLNGIAFDSLNKKMFITGKLWPVLFEIQLSK